MPSEDVIKATVLSALLGVIFFILWIKCIYEWYINKSIQDKPKLGNNYLLIFPILAAVMAIFCGILTYRNPQQLIEYVPVWDEIMTVGCGIFLGSMTAGTFCLGNYCLLSAVTKLKTNRSDVTVNDIALALLLIGISFAFPILLLSLYISELTLVGDVIFASGTLMLHIITLFPNIR